MQEDKTKATRGQATRLANKEDYGMVDQILIKILVAALMSRDNVALMTRDYFSNI